MAGSTLEAGRNGGGSRSGRDELYWEEDSK